MCYLGICVSFEGCYVSYKLCDTQNPIRHSGRDLHVKRFSRFFICVSKNRRVRRLHRWGGCGVKPGANITEFEGHDTLQGIQYDAACKHCWKKCLTLDSDSSDSSDSTDVSCASS